MENDAMWTIREQPFDGSLLAMLETFRKRADNSEWLDVAASALNEAAGKAGELAKNPLVAEYGGDMQTFLAERVGSLAVAGRLLAVVVEHGASLHFAVERARNKLGELETKASAFDSYKRAVAQCMREHGHTPQDAEHWFVRWLDETLTKHSKLVAEHEQTKRQLAAAQEKESYWMQQATRLLSELGAQQLPEPA